MKVFISYRRSDFGGHAEGFVGRIFDRLVSAYGEQNVFMDVDRIPPGVRFDEYINAAVVETDILLAVIGTSWLDELQSRAGDERDFVRMEIECALKQSRLVVPLLVGDAQMPRTEELPESLVSLALHNAYRVDSGRDFNAHMARLIEGLGKSLAEQHVGKSDHTDRSQALLDDQEEATQKQPIEKTTDSVEATTKPAKPGATKRPKANSATTQTPKPKAAKRQHSNSRPASTDSSKGASAKPKSAKSKSVKRKSGQMRSGATTRKLCDESPLQPDPTELGNSVVDKHGDSAFVKAGALIGGAGLLVAGVYLAYHQADTSEEAVMMIGIVAFFSPFFGAFAGAIIGLGFAVAFGALMDWAKSQ